MLRKSPSADNTLKNSLKTSLLMALRDAKIPCEQRTWRNFSGNVKVMNAIVVQAENFSQVLKLRKIHNEVAKSLTLRPAAGWKSKQYNCLWETHYQNEYNQSFSFSDGAEADVILLFDPKFQRVGKVNADKLTVDVTSGVKIGKLADELAKQGYALPTSSMLPHASIALAATAGHGTGRDQPSFAGLIEEMTILHPDGTVRRISEGLMIIEEYDENGNKIRETRDDAFKDFKTIRGAHMGLWGIVLGLKLRCVPDFKLKETLYAYNTAEDLEENLDEHLKSDYLSLMYIPGDNKTQFTFQARVWEKTNEEPTADTPAYDSTSESFFQQTKATIGGPALNLLVKHPEMHQYIPLFHELAANNVIGTQKKVVTRIASEHAVSHPIVAYPPELYDLSILFPVKDATAARTIGGILKDIEGLLKSYAEKGLYPLTYAFYVRYFKGTNGGLSTSATQSDDERICALEFVTHPNAPGLEQFTQDVFKILVKHGIPEERLRFHLGKHTPDGVTYGQYGEKTLNEVNGSLARWHKTTLHELKESRSTLLTPNLKHMLFDPSAPLIKQNPVKSDLKIVQTSPTPSSSLSTQEQVNSHHFLRGLHEMHCENEAALAIMKKHLGADKIDEIGNAKSQSYHFCQLL